MRHELSVFPDEDTVAREAAQYVSRRARAAVDEFDGFTFAVSGGHTPWAMFAELASLDMPWAQTTIFQVDERVAPPDDPDRNLHHLRDSLGSVSTKVVAMAVEAPDTDAAAEWYAQELPAAFDLIHLGLGPDGHTASLVPGDGVLEVQDRLVAPTTGTYQGRHRMTLTYPALSRARRLLWLVTGEAKADALSRLMSGDTSIPAGSVRAGASLVMADEAAASALSAEVIAAASPGGAT